MSQLQFDVVLFDVRMAFIMLFRNHHYFSLPVNLSSGGMFSMETLKSVSSCPTYICSTHHCLKQVVKGHKLAQCPSSHSPPSLAHLLDNSRKPAFSVRTLILYMQW